MMQRTEPENSAPFFFSYFPDNTLQPLLYCVCILLGVERLMVGSSKAEYPRPISSKLLTNGVIHVVLDIISNPEIYVYKICIDYI